MARRKNLMSAIYKECRGGLQLKGSAEKPGRSGEKSRLAGK